MRSITEIKNFENKKVLLRVDWNVPFDKFKASPTDSSRIEISLPTIQYIKNHNGWPIVASHFGRQGESIGPVINFAQKNYPVLAEGVEFLENLRIDKGEEENNEEFALELANKAKFYINEAFSVSHRSHASIVGVPKFLPSFVGLHFIQEVANLSKAFNSQHPFLLILGGAKLETKLPMIEKFLNVADYIFVGGGLATEALKLPIANNSKIIFPAGDPAALDANEETLDILKLKIENSKFVLWNGPLGKYEDGHTKGTEELAKILADCEAEVIVGGGDTENVIDDLGVKDKFAWVSLAGGAMLEFLEKRTLPGIKALD